MKPLHKSTATYTYAWENRAPEEDGHGYDKGTSTPVDI
jgi:hypothetical protein